MKFKANRACDLSTICIFPPQSRRLSATTVQRRDHKHRILVRNIRSNHFQRGFLPSMACYRSYPRLLLTKRFGSQERENSAKKPSYLPPIIYSREESQMLISRTSTNVIRKWNPASFQDYKFQISEELERRVGIIETSLNKLGMILDSV